MKVLFLINMKDSILETHLKKKNFLFWYKIDMLSK